jgi:CheY-like chemotaxis protein
MGPTTPREREADSLIEPDPPSSVRPVDYILVVEDDNDVREGLVELIRSEGYAVVDCCDGRAAMDRLCGCVELPVLIILDFMMPRMDGWQFLAERQNNPRLRAIPVVGISAAKSLERKGRFPEGVAEILHKPFSVEVILGSIERHWPSRARAGGRIAPNEPTTP